MTPVEVVIDIRTSAEILVHENAYCMEVIPTQVRSGMFMKKWDACRVLKPQRAIRPVSQSNSGIMAWVRSCFTFYSAAFNHFPGSNRSTWTLYTTNLNGNDVQVLQQTFYWLVPYNIQFSNAAKLFYRWVDALFSHLHPRHNGGV